jgi:hypothetical protein
MKSMSAIGAKQTWSLLQQIFVLEVKRVLSFLDYGGIIQPTPCGAACCLR